MARFPGAIWKPITADKDRKRLTIYNRMNLHVAVSETSSLHGYFNQRGVVDSHFYVRRDGTVEQYVDTAYRAYADLEGNDATISVETQGMGGGTWTPEQRESLARLFAWAVKTHGIARKLATSSAPGDASRGLSWHRLGVPHRGTYSHNGVVVKQLTSTAPGYLQSRNHIWFSGVVAKACPGDDRIPQVPGIFRRAEEILDGKPAEPTKPEKPSKPTPPSKPAPAPRKPYIKALQRAVRADDDNVWGSDTDRRFTAVREASRYGGSDFPYGVAYTQRVVGTPDDGDWGPRSAAAHDRTVAAIQRALGVSDDGVWGPKTESAFQAIRAKARA